LYSRSDLNAEIRVRGPAVFPLAYESVVLKCGRSVAGFPHRMESVLRTSFIRGESNSTLLVNPDVFPYTTGLGAARENGDTRVFHPQLSSPFFPFPERRTGILVGEGRLELPTCALSRRCSATALLAQNRTYRWWALLDSDQRHPACRAGTLPTELNARGSESGSRTQSSEIMILVP
jgi:hypothetical protein